VRATLRDCIPGRRRLACSSLNSQGCSPARSSFLEARQFVGAQLKYSWRQVEPERDLYNLQPILDDLAFLNTRGKRLFVQLQDVSFSEDVLVPDYLLNDPAVRARFANHSYPLIAGRGPGVRAGVAGAPKSRTIRQRLYPTFELARVSRRWFTTS
jgi:hypothetical protein